MSQLFKRISSLKTHQEFRSYLQKLGLSLDFDHSLEVGENSPIAQPANLKGKNIGNRFCVLPMEGWDGEEDGKPSPLTQRRCQIDMGRGSCSCSARRTCQSKPAHDTSFQYVRTWETSPTFSLGP